jgi:tetratricopeptide (TPR) repeat protein
MALSGAAPTRAGTVRVIRPPDPVSRFLGVAIGFVIVTALTGVLYFLITGVLNPPAPRTALETQQLLLSGVVAKNPKSGAAWSDYIKTVTQTGDYRMADQLVKRGRASVEGDQRIMVDLAALELLTVQGDYKAADKLADKILEEDKVNRAKAIETLIAKGVRMKPTDIGVDVAVQARLGKAKVAANLKHWDVAIKQLTEALDFSPRSADLLALRGQAKLELGKKAEAKKDFEAALRFDPEYRLALDGLKKVGE